MEIEIRNNCGYSVGIGNHMMQHVVVFGKTNSKNTTVKNLGASPTVDLPEIWNLKQCSKLVSVSNIPLIVGK